MSHPPFSFCCPVCGEPLSGQALVYCKNNHCYNRAKSGYLYLLPPQKSGNKTHGDDRQMVLARKEFLSAGYYDFLKDALSQTAKGLVSSPSPTLLDSGCGEGFYTKALTLALGANSLGIDISRAAVQSASVFCKEAGFGVASCYHLPILSESCDLVCSFFSPIVPTEFSRVLKQGGHLLIAIPGELHLMELKEILYEHPYLKPVKEFELEGFRLLSKERLTRKIELPDRQTVSNLFQMTPYSYKTSLEDQKKLESVDGLTVTADFWILAYRKDE